ncbi:MAG: MotA/TolQ/ExbB proton channel family protein [Planctomycetales bacterium]|nr:MotA/TolQ/ExbB proton channel family protein [Planctomycetales bacterium]
MLEIIFAGGAFGIAIMVAIIALSMTGCYLVIDHLLTIRRQELVPDALQAELAEHFANGKVAAAEASCQEHPSFLSFIILQGLAERDGGWPAIEKAFEDALAEQAAALLRKIEYLAVIGNIAPMLGLLGTVTGMILAFRQVAVSQGAAGAGDLAEGIYQALVTTVAGLVVAIPSLGAYAILRNRVDQLVAEATYVIQHVTRPLRRRLAVAPPVRSAAPRNS